ncbi:MAG: uroporphyrinogen-III C-methyltransferase [Pseudomonadota bacterium]
MNDKPAKPSSDQTKNSDNKTKNNAIKKSTSPIGKGNSSRKLSGSMLKYLILLLILVLVIAVALLSSNYWRQQQKQYQQLKRQLSAITQQNQTLQQKIAAIQTNREQLSKNQTALNTLQQYFDKLKQQNDQQQQLITTMSDNNAKLHQQLLGNDATWLVAEALYLSRLANYTLVFQRDISTSISLLNTADQLLHRTGNPNVLPLRQAITKDITNLEMIKPVDIAGLYLKLQALRRIITALPIMDDHISTMEANKNNGDQKKLSPQDNWQDRLKININQVLNNLVIVKRKQGVDNFPVSILSKDLLGQYTALLITQAQSALLTSNQNIYQNALAQLTAVMHKYYNKNATTQQILSTIATLNRINIKPKLPDLNKTIIMLSDYYKNSNKNAQNNSTDSSIQSQQSTNTDSAPTGNQS